MKTINLKVLAFQLRNLLYRYISGVAYEKNESDFPFHHVPDCHVPVLFTASICRGFSYCLRSKKTGLQAYSGDCFHIDGETAYFRGFKIPNGWKHPTITDYYICSINLKTGKARSAPLPAIKVPCKFHPAYGADSIFLKGTNKLVSISKRTLKVNKTRDIAPTGSCSLSLIEDMKTGKKYIPVYSETQGIKKTVLLDENFLPVFTGENIYTPSVRDGVAYSATIGKNNVIEPFLFILSSKTREAVRINKETGLNLSGYIYEYYQFVPLHERYVFNYDGGIGYIDKNGVCKSLLTHKWTSTFEIVNDVLVIDEDNKLLLYDTGSLDKVKEISIKNYEPYLYPTSSYDKFLLLRFDFSDPSNRIKDHDEEDLILFVDKKGNFCRKIYRKNLSDFRVINDYLYILTNHPVTIEKIDLRKLLNHK